MSLAIALTFEAGIIVVFVDSISIQISEPRLDVSGRYKDRHSFTRLTSFISRFDAVAFNLLYSVSSISSVSIDKHNQCLPNAVLSFSVIGKFLNESFPHVLLSRPTASRTDLDSLYPVALARSLKKSAGKRLMLPVFAQDDNVDITAHNSHPLAMTSESLIPPSIAISREGRTIVTPVVSRLSTRPRSPPR